MVTQVQIAHILTVPSYLTALVMVIVLPLMFAHATLGGRPATVPSIIVMTEIIAVDTVLVAGLTNVLVSLVGKQRIVQSGPAMV